MKASDLFVKCLENEGVEYIFGLPGEEILDLLDSISKSKIKFITTRHEQGASFMANVYGRLTGKPGVCLSTSGPGATNLITGVTDANLDKAPLVAITGQVGVKSMYKESHQYIDVVQIFKYVTKWNGGITKADSIPEIVSKAFKIAKSEKPGATHIELPEDVALENTDMKPLKIENIQSAEPDVKAIKKSISMIKDSKNPIIIAGNGVIRANASKELSDFARKNNTPVVTTFMGKGAISAKEDLYVGTIGLQEKDYVICGLHASDLIINVGRDLIEYSLSRWNPEKNKKIIHIDSKHPEVDTHCELSVDLVGDIKKTLKLLIKYKGFKKDVNYSLMLKNYIKREFEKYKNDKSFPMKPQKIIYDIRKALKEDDILISDVGAHKIWLGRLYPAYKPNTFIVSNGFSSMGISLPAAIIAKLVKPNKNVLAVSGDGGFLMGVQELETAKRLGLDFVVLIFNDRKYGLIEWNQINKFGKGFGSEFTNPDFVKLAKSFGGNGYKVEKASELSPLLKEALSAEGINIIDVEVDSFENLKLTEKLGKLICPP